MITPHKLNRSYRRFKFYNQDDHPFLFLFLDIGFFALKVAVIGGALLLAYKLLNGSYSTADSVDKRTETSNAPTRTATATIERATLDKIIPSTPPDDSTAIASDLIIEPALRTTITTTSTPATLHNESWLLAQDREKFTIQFGSSPDRQLMLDYARSFANDAPLSLYPYKKTPTNRPIYGLARGIYNSLDNASKALDTLPSELKTFSPWIRPIGKLQDQIRKLDS